MSIINEAIKKARKTYTITSGKSKAPASDKKAPGFSTPASSQENEIKWTVAIVVSLILIVSLLGSIVLYKHFSRTEAVYKTKTQGLIPQKASRPWAAQKRFNRRPRTEAVNMELNGIVYGPKDKWAVINDRIVRENDILLGGRVSVIAKDYVRVEKDNGEEVVLNLR